MRLINVVSYLSIGVLIVCINGCDSKPMQIIAENESGQRLENVAFSSGGKLFKFGVLVHEGTKGYMTAGRLFSNGVPDKMTLNFESVDGEKFSREVKFDPTDRGQVLRLVIDSNLEVTGTRD